MAASTDGGGVDALFLSDVHVSAARPLAVARLLALLDGPARGCPDVYVLGDLFDQWLGDDDTTEPYPAVERALRGLADAGTRVRVLHGNHDFLLGDAFAERTRTALVADPFATMLGDTPMVLSHGDALCTDDTDYQSYRAMTREPDTQRWFLGLPMAERRAMAAELRHRSAELKPLKSDEIMDVNADAVRALLRRHGARELIHGHTHRPAMHNFTLDGKPARRTVLGDWYEEGRVGVWASGRLSLEPVSALVD